MHLRFAAVRSAVGCLAVSFVSACGGSDAGPLEGGTSPTPVSIVVTPTDGVVAVDQVIAFAAVVTRSDGTTEDVTERATWTSSDDSVLRPRVNSDFIGIDEGTATVTATFEELAASVGVEVTSPIVELEVVPRGVTIDVNETREITAIGTFATGARTEVTTQVDWESSDTSVFTVAAGRVTGVAPGNAVVTARAGEVTATSRIAVREPTIVGLDIRGPDGVLPAGQTVQLTAEATLSSGATMDITGDVVWRSEAPAVATIGNDPDNAGLVTGVAVGRTGIVAVHPPTALEATRAVAVSAPILERVVVEPRTSEINAGEFQFLTAVAIFTDGSRESITRRVRWRTSDEAVATVSNEVALKGRVGGLRAGTAQISVFDEATGFESDEMGSATVTVRGARLASLQVEPATGSTPAGRTFQFTARANFSDGTSRIVTDTVQWSSLNAAVATIDANGLATGLTTGASEISARDPQSGLSSGPLSGRLEVTPAVIDQLTVTLDPPVIVQDQSRLASAQARFSDGSMAEVRDLLTWRSSDNGVVVAFPGGDLRGVSVGTATVTATDPATMVTASVVVRVDQLRQLQVRILPSQLVLPVGAESEIQVEASFNDGSVVDLTSTATYTNSNPLVLERGRLGNRRDRVFGRAPGTARLTAVDSTTGNRDQLDLTVTSTLTLTGLAVSAPQPSVAVGLGTQLTALGTYSNGDVYNLTHAVTWASSEERQATISNLSSSAGILTGVRTGTTAVTISSGTIVSPPLLVTVREPIVTRRWGGPIRTVDGTGFTTLVDVGSVDFGPADFPTGAVVRDVNITIDFLKTDGTCSSPQPFNAFHNETHFRLRAPDGTRVVLAPPSTWSGATAISDVQVTFDDSATVRPSGIPQSGVFLPSQSLSGFNGLRAQGTWVLEAGDTSNGDPLCVNAYSITVRAL